MSFTHTTSDLARRIEAALIVLAYCIELDGDVHLPMYEKFESELASLRAAEHTRERALQRLHAFRATQMASAETKQLPHASP